MKIVSVVKNTDEYMRALEVLYKAGKVEVIDGKKLRLKINEDENKKRTISQAVTAAKGDEYKVNEEKSIRSLVYLLGGAKLRVGKDGFLAITSSKEDLVKSEELLSNRIGQVPSEEDKNFLQAELEMIRDAKKRLENRKVTKLKAEATKKIKDFTEVLKDLGEAINDIEYEEADFKAGDDFIDAIMQKLKLDRAKKLAQSVIEELVEVEFEESKPINWGKFKNKFLAELRKQTMTPKEFFSQFNLEDFGVKLDSMPNNQVDNNRLPASQKAALRSASQRGTNIRGNNRPREEIMGANGKKKRSKARPRSTSHDVR